MNAPVTAIAVAIEMDLEAGDSAEAVLGRLVRDFGGKHRFAYGTNELKIAGVKVTNTSGGENLLRAWATKARAS